MAAFTVCVEGNIASGKTTFLKLFHASCHQNGKGSPLCKVMEEPVAAWQNLQGHNILDLMYKDPSRWGHLFQSYVALTMTQIHTQDINEPIKLMERSLLTAEKCFAANLYSSGHMSKPEYLVLREWYAYLNTKVSVRPDLIVYLRTSPETCLKRMTSRSRSEESSVPLSYLKDLHSLHEDCLLKDQRLSTPVLVVDAEANLQQSPELFHPIFNKIIRHFEANRQDDKENSYVPQ